MDYLTRLFLELKAAEDTSASLPFAEELSPGTVLRRRPDGTEKPDFSVPEQGLQPRLTAVRQLHRLLEETQAVGSLAELHSIGVKKQDRSAHRHYPTENGWNGFSAPFSPGSGNAPTPEAFSRFFERDARRYG